MRENRVRNKMQQGQLAFGTYVSMRDPAIVEIIGLAGFDAAFIDMEHTAFNLETVEDMIRACDAIGITSFVRVPENNPKTILRILDAGAQAIQVPHISSVKDAREAIKAVRYPPLGKRGVGGPTRAARYGLVSPKEYMPASNADILLAVMIEDMGAVRQLAEIASLPGLDLIAVGPSDLSSALGVTDSKDPLLKKTIEGIVDTLIKTGKAKLTFPLGNAIYPVSVDELKQMGAAYSNCGPLDVNRLLISYQQQIKEIEAQIN
jgi:2-keto-3-deoxy-L-rhamnonate aldolase RhmA